MSLDQAPVSSSHVRVHLLRNTTLHEMAILPLSIVTTVTRDDKAETVVQRPHTEWLDIQRQWDQEIMDALRRLSGQSGSLIMSMGRTFTVTWDGICRPV